MSSVSYSAKSACLRLLALVLLLAGPLLCGSAYAQDEEVRVNITFTVVDKETGKPIPKTSVFISRNEKLGDYILGDIKAPADSLGLFKKDHADFLLGKTH